MGKIIIKLILVLLPSTSFAWDDWSTTDKALFVASNVAIVADWATTRYGSKHYDDVPGVYETNKILGKYPSTQKVDAYFVVLLVSNYFIADWIGKDMRGFYLTVRTVSHGYAAKHNTELGWQLKF